MASVLNVSLKIENSSVRKILLGNIQNAGARPYQEDSFGFSPISREAVAENGLTAVVSDGMGGLLNGDLVSKYTVAAIIEKLSSYRFEIPVHSFFTQTFNDVNRYICANYPGGGATATAVYCCSKGVYFCSTGDSRVYLYRKGSLFRMTKDFDYLDKLLDEVITGECDMEDALDDSRKDSLQQYIGANLLLTPDVSVKPFVPLKGDKLILCSDGVYNAIEENEITAALSLKANEAADDIYRRISEKNYRNQDNYTAAILEFV